MDSLGFPLHSEGFRDRHGCPTLVADNKPTAPGCEFSTCARRGRNRLTMGGGWAVEPCKLGGCRRDRNGQKNEGMAKPRIAWRGRAMKGCPAAALCSRHYFRGVRHGGVPRKPRAGPEFGSQNDKNGPNRQNRGLLPKMRNLWDEGPRLRAQRGQKGLGFAIAAGAPRTAHSTLTRSAPPFRGRTKNLKTNERNTSDSESIAGNSSGRRECGRRWRGRLRPGFWHGCVALTDGSTPRSTRASRLSFARSTLIRR